MARRKRRKFSDEFKQEAVRLCKEGNRSIGDVARELDLTESALRSWVKQHDGTRARVHAKRSRLRSAKSSGGFAKK